jgi:ribosome-associated protein
MIDLKSKQIMEIALKALDSKKGIDIRAVDVSDITPIAEYMIFASGGSTSQVNALSDEVEYKLSKQGVEPHHIEGKQGWILLDYPGVVVNVLDVKSREFYNLERLWADGKEVDLSAILQ